MCGSSVLLLADVLGRVALKVSVLPVGAITALIGGPMFLWLLLREKKTMKLLAKNLGFGYEKGKRYLTE